MTTGTAPLGKPFRMASRETVDLETRARIRAWLKWKMEANNLNISATAELMGVSAAAVSRVADGQRAPGLDFVLRMYRRLHIPMEQLVDSWPPKVKLIRA